MKIIIELFSFLIVFGANGPDLQNTEWIKIKAERKDGSKIIDRIGPDTISTKYYFLGDSVSIGLSQQYAYNEPYSVRDNILSIGEIGNFQIDSLNEAFLFISQVSNKGLADDKLNSYVFINADYLFDYMKKNQLLNIIGDSVVFCDDRFSPTLKGNIYHLLFQAFPDVFTVKSIAGSFIIAPDGIVKNVQVDSSGKFSHKEIDKIIKTIYATNGSWILPPTPMPLQFKINFYFNFVKYASLYTLRFNFFTNDEEKGLNTQQIADADRYFYNGMRLFDKGKFENAVNEFKQCIAIDSTNTDAYYNLAYSYQKLGKKELACEIWKKLDEMGQKTGKELYDANCR